MGGGWCLASLIDSVSPPLPLLQPWPPDILTEDDVYCSCLAKTLCHVPVPVTVGFYAPFGCRLHMMLDKITGEDLCVLGVGVQETERLVPAQPQASPRSTCPAFPSANAHNSAFTRSRPCPQPLSRDSSSSFLSGLLASSLAPFPCQIHFKESF